MTIALVKPLTTKSPLCYVYDMTVRVSNPFRRLRQTQGISQYELGRRAGVSKHAVLRLEQGMYDKPLPSMVEYFIKHYPITSAQLLDEYTAFQIATREDNARCLGDTISILNHRPSMSHPLTFIRQAPTVQKNLTEVAKCLCISQTVLNNFENKPISQKTVPQQLIIALQDADYTEEETGALEKAYADFRRFLVDKQNCKLVAAP